MSNIPKEERDVSNEADISFLIDVLEEPESFPAFEFSSPISSIGSNCSSPDRDRAHHAPKNFDEMDCDDFDEFVSLEELKSRISPPSEGDASTDSKKVEYLETIFEDCYLETPPGTPTSTRPNKARRFRMNLNSFEEFKEQHVQNSVKKTEQK